MAGAFGTPGGLASGGGVSNPPSIPKPQGPSWQNMGTRIRKSAKAVKSAATSAAAQALGAK